MQKFMILLIFLKLLIVISSDDDFIFKIKCEDNKAKTGACMYYLSNTDSKGNSISKYAIFDKCGKGEYCSFEDEVCVENLEKRKIGKSCNYDNDCVTGSCVSNKCTANKEGEKCKSSSCERGLECHYESNNSYKCVKLVKEGEKIEASKPHCMNGLGVDKDNKCVKYGTVADKTEIGVSSPKYICKSGFAHLKYDEHYNFYKICDSIKTEPVCGENGIKTNGKWSDDKDITDGCDTATDYTGANIYYNSKYSNLKSKLFADFIDDYKDLDLDNLNTNEKYTSWLDGMKQKTREKWLLYEYANELRAAGIIDSDGKVIKDKKCEYDFLKKQLDSNYIKLSTIILALFALLF